MKNLNHLNRLYFASAIIIFFMYSCKEKVKADVVSVVSNSDSLSKNQGLYIDLQKVLDSRSPAEALTVHVKYDHYFHSPKKYEGYFLNNIIDSVVKLNNFDTANAIVIFECIDGYDAKMNISKIFDSAKGYIVYKDLDQKNGKDWADSISSKFKPYYLVWDDVKKENQGYKWPYGLVGLKLIH